MFCGSDRGGQRAAAMYSLIVTAKMNGVDPQAWLADTLARIDTHPGASTRRIAAVELDARRPHDDRRGGLTLSSVNKVHHVLTIARVAEMLGEDEDWL
jgi:hypothetical protein